ncbi:MAG: hypothetical protein JOZ39_12225 [Chloroflexi bacterium]|nr:hypothetical protein [Chloroflexota bacterium]
MSFEDIRDIIGWIVEAILLTGVLWLLVRRVALPDVRRPLLWVTMSSFALRAAIGLALFLISLYQLPILRSMQLPGGFWTLAIDASGYDWEAHRVLNALGGAPLGQLVSPAFAWLLGLVYYVFGQAPTQGLLMNSAFAAACGPLVYAIGRTCKIESRRSLVAAIIVCYFPSTFAWSAQLLKDALQWLIIIVVLLGAAQIMAMSEGRKRLHWRLAIVPVLAIMAASLLTAWLRGNSTSPVLLGSMLLGVLLWTLAEPARAAGPAIGRQSKAAAGRISQWWSFAVAQRFGLLFLLERIKASPPRLVPSIVVFGAVALGTLPAYVSFLPLATGPAVVAGPRPNIYINTDTGEVVTLPPPKPRPVATGGAAGAEEPEASAEAEAPEAYDLPAMHLAPLPPPPAPTSSLCKALGIYGLAVARDGFVRTGGYTIIDPTAQFRNCFDILKYTPRAFQMVFLAPGPTDWFRNGVSVGAAKYFEFMDSVIIWALVPGLIVGMAQAIRRPVAAKTIIAMYVLVFGFVMGFVVANFGTLYRIRLQVWLPAAVLSADGWFVLWAWLSTALRRKRQSAPAAVSPAPGFEMARATATTPPQ